MDNQGNRLYLNIGGSNNNNRLGVASDRAYPTTPSTFPQPVYPPQAGQQGQQPQAQQKQQQQQQKQQQYGYGQQPGYFLPTQHQQQHQYPAAYPGQAMPSHHTDFAQGGLRTPGASNDPNTGLAHKFSHQNLGGAAQSGGYGSRGPSPAGAPRPRTAGGSGQAPSYGYLNAPMPGQPGSKPYYPDFEAAPERNPDKYGSNANNNQKKCSQLAADFFKDSVKRARERNQR